MKIQLVNPPRFQGIPIIREDRCENADRNCVQPPTSLVYIASILEADGHEVSLVDCNAYDIGYDGLSGILRKEKFDALVFRSTPSTYLHDCRVAKIAKKQDSDVDVLMLNWNLNAFSRQVLEVTPDVDVYIHSYSYENILSSLFNSKSLDMIEGITYRDNKEVIVNPVNRIRKVGDIPRPLWNLIPDHSVFYTRVKSISPWGVVRGSKGCGFSCMFCVDRGITFDPRSPFAVVDELEDLVKNHGVKFVSFFDDTFTVDRNWVIKICDEIVNRGLRFKWFINTRVNLVDRELLGVMKAAGLDGVSLGVESGSDVILKRMKKGHTAREACDSIQLIKGMGIKTYVSLMLGYLDETREQMMETYRFIVSSKPNAFQISVTIPFPNTPLYAECLGRDLVDDGLSWDEFSCIPTSLDGKLSLTDLSFAELRTLRLGFYARLYLNPRFLIPNFVWMLQHPSDLKMACQYFVENFRRLMNKVTYSH